MINKNEQKGLNRQHEDRCETVEMDQRAEGLYDY